MKHPAFVCCAVSFLFLGATSVQAQETSDLTDVHFYPPSAVSMMKYIDYPVSHRTGIPEISIPLYTVRSGSLELPVNLSFHLDDFTRVNQLAGAAGAGWSLSCDMQVSRIINGVDDLKTTGYLHTGISKPDITSTTLVRSTTDRMRLLWRKGADEDPDRFYYKLLNGGGSFYIERELGPKTVPVTGDRIVFDELGTETFVITGTDGTIYHFSSAVADTASEIPSDIKSKTAWKCTEIESADGGSSITFSYLPYRSRVLQTPGSVSLYDRGELYTTNDEVRYAARYPREERYGSIIYSCTLLFGWDDEGYGPTNFFWKELPDQPENSSTVSKWVESHYIDRITFRGGYAQFEYEAYDDTRTRILNPVLERIVICDTQGVARQTIVFTQSNVDQRYERYLQSVQIGNDTYSFSYGMQHIGDAIADFWGYGYRGHYSGGSADVPCHKVLLDLGTDPVDMYGDKLTYPGDYFQREFSMPSNSFPDEIYRTPDEEKRLLSITYPTGGRTEFVCDHNCFRDGEDAVRRISSYRIKYIRYYDTDDTLLKETAYKYGPGEDGCGIIRHEPDMDDDMGNCHTEQTVSYYYPRDSWSGSYSLGATLRLRTYYPHTIYRTNYDDGSHVQYDEVAEYQSAGGTLSGKTVYKYDLTNRHARPVREVFAYPNAPYPVEGDTWYLGQLDSVVQYKYDGGRFDWVARRAYTYNRYDASERIFCARVWASAVGYLLGGSQQIDDGHTFEYSYNGITPGCMQLSEEVIEQREDDGRILRRRTNYYYDTNPYTASRKETDLRRRTNRHRADALRRRLPAVERADDARSQPSLAPARTGRLHRRDRHARRYVPLRSLRASRQPLDAGFARPLARIVPLLEPQLYGRERRLYARHALHRTGVAALRRRRQHLRGAGRGTASDLLSVGLQGSVPRGRNPQRRIRRGDDRLGCGDRRAYPYLGRAVGGRSCGARRPANQPQGVARHHGDIHPAGGDGLDDRSFGT
ncbi:MAG: hypothetical protein ACLSHL_00735 [Alistipes communis]